MNILLTGAAGFVGSHVAEALLARGDAVKAGIPHFVFASTSSVYGPRGRPDMMPHHITDCIVHDRAFALYARALLGYHPTTSVAEGQSRFWEWYQAEAIEPQ